MYIFSTALLYFALSAVVIDNVQGERISDSPIILPAYHRTATFNKNQSSCMLYLEGITILILDHSTIGEVQKAYTLPLFVMNDSYVWKNKYADCSNTPSSDAQFSFVINYIVKEPRHLKTNDDTILISIDSGFKLTLNFVHNSGFNLASATLEDLVVQKGANTFMKNDISASGDAKNVKSTNIRAYYGYNYACSATPALIFESNDKNIDVGIILNNFQVQGYGIDIDPDRSLPSFSSKVTDCIPTFSQGSWMGIIVTILLVTVLMFAFLMLNSVQTMDKFDDPKQKQIQINFKE